METINSKYEDNYFEMNSMEQIINMFARSCENNNYVKYDIIIDIGKMEKMYT